MKQMKHLIAKTIGIQLPSPGPLPPVPYQVQESIQEEGYTRQLLTYDSGGDSVPAYLLIPDVLSDNPAILIHHQHNREHHLGKDEVCGLAGNPLQAFGPALAKRGFVVLAPDSVCFANRRRNLQEPAPLPEGFDFWQHYNEMCYRLIRGECLMKKVLEDARNGITLLYSLPYVRPGRIGTMGHSYGGNTSLFLSALDDRVLFCCASGCACTYENRMQNNVGIEIASVIPGIHGRYDIDDLVCCIAPRRLLLVSAEEDKYSMDAPCIVEKARHAYAKWGAGQNLYHKRYSGGHAMTQERFDAIIEWLDAYA